MLIGKKEAIVKVEGWNNQILSSVLLKFNSLAKAAAYRKHSSLLQKSFMASFLGWSLFEI
jgi:hypothetical protein